MEATVVIPNWNGREWLEGCLESVVRQSRPAAEVILVDNGSTDGSVELVRRTQPAVRVLELDRNTGFAHAANRGFAAARTDALALLNNDVVLEPGWIDRMVNALEYAPEAAAVACKMVDLQDPTLLYDTGDVMRRDGACVQRGRYERDTGRFDSAGEVFGACAGAALYRREAVMSLGGFDERFWMYLEDVDLALRLRLAGWTCRYEPAVAHHAGEGSSSKLSTPLAYWVARNTVLIVAKTFPARWAPQVIYRQLAAARHAARRQRLGAHLRGLLDGLSQAPRMFADRRRLRRGPISIRQAVPPAPIRGPRSVGHPSRHAVSARH